MQRPPILPSAFALVASLAVLSCALAAPAHASEPLPDPHILSAVPFEFHADRAILSPVPDVPTDSRIFSPRKSAPRGEKVYWQQRA